MSVFIPTFTAIVEENNAILKLNSIVKDREAIDFGFNLTSINEAASEYLGENSNQEIDIVTQTKIQNVKNEKPKHNRQY